MSVSEPGTTANQGWTFCHVACRLAMVSFHQGNAGMPDYQSSHDVNVRHGATRAAAWVLAEKTHSTLTSSVLAWSSKKKQEWKHGMQEILKKPAVVYPKVRIWLIVKKYLFQENSSKIYSSKQH